MESLPDHILQSILSNINNARDVAACNCVSKGWKDSMAYIRSLYFPRNSFVNLAGNESSDNIIKRMVSTVVRLQELVVYSPFSSFGLASWLSHVGLSLSQLELRIQNFGYNREFFEIGSKLDCIGAARNLKSLKLWRVVMINYLPQWDVFQNLRTLEIIGSALKDHVLTAVLLSCPNLTRLSLLGCGGARAFSIDLQYLEQCKLIFRGYGNFSLSLTSPKIESLEVHGCSSIRVPETKNLRTISISNNSGRVDMVDFGNLAALEFLSMRGVYWRWESICKMLELASEVKHLYMKIEFAADYVTFFSFPEIDFVDFFNNHPKLRKFDIHGGMFAALCQKNSLKHVDPGFVIPCLEEVVITVKKTRNAEQKISTLESLLKYGKNLRTMVIKIFQMTDYYSNISVDDFLAQICWLRYLNHEIVRIE
ncbi:F-box protein At1g10780-like [Gastrolobium bilobum]|uniref:F-box protein At1g10780-like n=1 Tax=Gastrolobium bilobum TaxID=150636 RepID=UPI002AB26E44|nr:F-box protein At1g10780-like [Gastrolobium bilobum]